MCLGILAVTKDGTDQTGQPTSETPTMWCLLDRVAGLERRAAALYERFARIFAESPLVAAFWREVASEERLHGLVVAAAREVFPATAPPPAGEWAAQLATVEGLLSSIESKTAGGVRLEDAFADAEILEASELNAVTALIIEHAGAGFSRLGAVVGRSGVDQHHDKMVEARQRFCAAVRPPQG